jgi:hypothetical protein
MTVANKCNYFVNDALVAGGDPPPLHPDGRPWLAGEWGDPAVTIPGYFIVQGPPKAGDIIAIKDPPGDGYTGHVGIFAWKDGKPATISASSMSGAVEHNDFGFRNEQTPVIRRCECDR